MEIKYLKPIKESTEDYDKVERKIKELFRKEIYFPIMRVLGLGQKTLMNAKYDLLEAIKYGRIQFYRGVFKGRFNADISKELKALGAQWDNRTGTWKLSQTSLTQEIKAAIQASESRFQHKIDLIDKKLTQFLPEEIADRLKVDHIFDSTLWKVQREFDKTIRGITVAPQLTKEQRARIAKEWQNNLKLYIKEWTQKEIVELRKSMQQSVFAGNRYETAVKTIEKSYDVSTNKAKFLARQETGLLMAKFKETRYQDAGVTKYKWTCVAGTPAHPVRPAHKALDGKVFSWDNPRELDKNGHVNSSGAHKPGDNKNPGEDYNCRCYAKPIVEFGKR
jgi:SPP1 gp7 family putative phage head morphogenesis protein